MATFVLWILGLTAKSRRFVVSFGSKKKQNHSVSILTLAKCWLQEKPKKAIRREIDNTLETLRGWAMTWFELV